MLYERKLDDESSWSRSFIWRIKARNYYFIILMSLAGTVITRVDYFTLVIGRFPTLSLGNFSKMTVHEKFEKKKKKIRGPGGGCRAGTRN